MSANDELTPTSHEQAVRLAALKMAVQSGATGRAIVETARLICDFALGECRDAGESVAASVTGDNR